MVDAVKKREIGIINIPNAFIQTVVTDKNKRVIVYIHGMLVTFL
jgi:hypothetical protein